MGLLNGHGAVYHDYHHTHNTGNFGGPANGLWDWVCGTQGPFLAYCESELCEYSGRRRDSTRSDKKQHAE